MLYADALTEINAHHEDPERRRDLPLEYAVEMNNLIKLEMEGAIG